jgi:hypothetical protein
VLAHMLLAQSLSEVQVLPLVPAPAGPQNGV